jgi:hypothetical protein
MINLLLLLVVLLPLSATDREGIVLYHASDFDVSPGDTLLATDAAGTVRGIGVPMGTPAITVEAEDLGVEGPDLEGVRLWVGPGGFVEGERFYIHLLRGGVVTPLPFWVRTAGDKTPTEPVFYDSAVYFMYLGFDPDAVSSFEPNRYASATLIFDTADFGLTPGDTVIAVGEDFGVYGRYAPRRFVGKSAMAVWANDTTEFSAVKDGFDIGEKVQLYAWRDGQHRRINHDEMIFQTDAIVTIHPVVRVGTEPTGPVATRLLVYPNPTAGPVTIEGGEGDVTVYDILGRIVLQTEQPTIDFAPFAPGTYIVRRGNETFLTTKL